MEEYQADELKSIVTCRNFRSEGNEPDPVRVMEKLSEQFPRCVSVSTTASGSIAFLAKTENMTRVRDRRLCDCSPEQIEQFSRPAP
jgi:hypothetical protein